MPATFTVTNTLGGLGQGTLQQAVHDANTNGNPLEQDQIEFNLNAPSGTIFLTSELDIVQSVRISGPSSNPGEIAINGFRIVVSAGGQTEIANLTLENSTGANAAIYNSFADVVVNNVVIENSSAGGINNYGEMTMEDVEITGAVRDGIRNDGELTATNVVVIDSGSAPGTAGVSNYGTMTIENATISDNFGGGIDNYSATLTLTGATVSNNSNSGISNSGIGATMTVDASTISGNSTGTAPGGGGIMNDATLLVTDSVVSGNSAANGGGLYNDTGATAVIVDSVIELNDAGFGGGIGNSGTMTISNTEIVSNDAEYEGGGVRNLESGDLTVVTSIIGGNTAPIAGAGISNVGSLTVRQTGFASNGIREATVLGGGIYSAGSLQVDGSSFSENSADSGGGVYTSLGMVNINNSTFVGNEAGSQGGGGLRTTGSATVTNSTFYNNVSDWGAAGIRSGGGLTLVNSTITQNFNFSVEPAGLQGGTSVHNSIIAGNVSASGDYDVDTSTLFEDFNNHIGTRDGDPLLGPFQDNGGPQQTMVPLPGSPLIDAGDDALAVDPDGISLLTDQRGPGVDRLVDGDGDGTATVDIGAAEFFGRETPTKFVVADQASLQTFGYDLTDSTARTPTDLDAANLDPRGVTTSDGTTWVLDQSTVFVSQDGSPAGSWEVTDVVNPTGIAVRGNDIWIVDNQGAASVLRLYEDATDFVAGEQAAANAVIPLDAANDNPQGLASDGIALLWVVQDNVAGVRDEVFRYETIYGSLQGSWELDAAQQSPTGITTELSSDVLWVVDAGTGFVHQYNNGAFRTAGSDDHDNTYSLDAANSAPVGITAPAVQGTTPAVVSPLLVTSAADDGPGSLREAIDLTNNSGAVGTIHFNASLFRETIRLESPLPAITRPLTITAPGTDQFGITIDAQGIVANPIVISADGVTIENLTIRNGSAAGLTGAVVNDGADTTLRNVMLRDNSSIGLGGAIWNTPSGGLILENTIVFNNTSDDLGGGIVNQGTLEVSGGSRIVSNSSMDSGGGIYSDGTLAVNQSTIAGNFNQSGGGGGVKQFGGEAVISDTTFWGNVSDGGGGGLDVGSGAIVDVVNSTLTENLAAGAGGGAMRFRGAGTTAYILNDTIVGNSDFSGLANGAGGVAKNGSGTLEVINTIIAQNQGTVFSVDDDVDRDEFDRDIRNFVGTDDGDPMLGRLRDNGGPTLTMGPDFGSPVIDAGRNVPTNQYGLVFDQRSDPYDRIVDGDLDGAPRVDQGAVEVQVHPDQFLPDGGPFGDPFDVLGNGTSPGSSAQETISRPSGNASSRSTGAETKQRRSEGTTPNLNVSLTPDEADELFAFVAELNQQFAVPVTHVQSPDSQGVSGTKTKRTWRKRPEPAHESIAHYFATAATDGDLFELLTCLKSLDH